MPSPYADMFGQGKNIAGAEDTNETLGKPRGRLAKTAGFLTSGTEFIGATSEALTGSRLDITRLPGYIEQPLDILANPLSLGFLAAAPFTGGASLTGLGARGVGQRLAGAALTDLAGGLVAGSAAQVSRDLLPDTAPDWLQLGIPLAAGVIGGAGAARYTAAKMPNALQAASRTGKSVEDLTTDLYATGRNIPKGVPSESPYDLPSVSPGLTKMEQIVNVARGIFPKLGLPIDERFNPILKQARKSDDAVESVKQVVNQEMLSDMKEFGIKHVVNPDGSAQNLWKVGNQTVAVQDAALHPSLFPELTPAQLGFLKKWHNELTNHRTTLGTVSGSWEEFVDPTTGATVKKWVPKTLEKAKFMDEDGFFMPRGRPIDDDTPDIVTSSGRPKNLKSTPGSEKEQVYPSVAEGVADKQYYPPLNEAVAEYVAGVGHAIMGRHALNQMEQLVDANGVPLIVNLARAYPLRDEYGNIIRDAEGKPQMNFYRADPKKSQFTLAGQQNLAAESSIARYLNNQIDPRNLEFAGSKLAEAFNKPLRTLHVAADMGDFIARLGPTNALLHPVIFAKYAGKGFAAMFNREIVGNEFKSINLENMTNGLNGMTVRDMASRGGLKFNQTDFAPGSLAKAPVLGKMGSVYGNALDLMRARMMQAEMLNKMKNGIDVFDPVNMRQIASGVNLTTGASNNPTPKGAAIFLQFPNWFQSQMELLAKGVSGKGMDGAYARRSLLGMLGLGAGAALLGNAAAGHPEKTISKDNDFVPTLYLGDQKINIFGPYASLWKGVWAAMEGDPSRLIRGRSSPLLTFAFDIGSGQTMVGDKAAIDDTEYWARSLLPYSFSSIISGLEQGQPVGGFLQAVGVNAREATPRQKIQEEAEKMFGKDYADFTGKEKQQLKLANPELFAELDRRTRERAEAGDKTSQGIVQSQAVTTALLQREQSLHQLLQSGELSPRQFREALNDSVREAAIKKQQIRKDYGLDEKEIRNPTPVQTALDKYYSLFDTADMGVLEGGTKVGQVNWEEFERQQAALLATFTPEQRKAIEDRVVIKHPDVEWYYKNRDLINESDYFQTTDKAFEQLRSSVQRRAPGAESLADLYRLQNIAVNKNDRATYVQVSSLINAINNIAEGQKKRMRLKDPALTKALIQNGYVSQPKAGVLVSRP